MQTLTDRREFATDPELPTADHLRIPVSAMRPGDFVTLGYTRFVVTYPLAALGGAAGRLLADTDNGNERELYGHDADKYSVERPVYTVEYRATHMGVSELVRVEHASELDAVHCMGSVILYENLTPVARGANIDPTRFAI